MIATSWILPDWPVPAAVHALITTRTGDGVSHGAFGAFNLGDHVGDAAWAVAENRRRLSMLLPSPPQWLRQVHGNQVVTLGGERWSSPPEADAAVTYLPEVVCAVLTADCLPVLMARADGAGVAVAHAGWRGLCNGILEQTVFALRGDSAVDVLVYLGPAIGPQQFEVGDEVRQAFVQQHEAHESAFVAGQPGKWWADIYQLAALRLRNMGISAIYGGGYCTVTDPKFFSYRRDGQTGRMASLVWLEAL